MFDQTDGNGAHSTVLSGDGIVLIPYVELDGSWTIPDAEMRKVYDTLVGEKLLEILMPEGAVKSAGHFLALMKSPANLPVVLYSEKNPAGIGWLNGLGRNSAFAHFCFFRSTWGRLTNAMGKKLLDYWFGFPGESGPLFDVLIGVLPAWNHKAAKYVRRMGFTHVGDVPMLGGASGSALFYKLRN